MFQTSADLLYGVIALCVLMFTFFLVWILFYIAQILREGYNVIRDIRQKIHEFEELLSNIREKVFSSATALTILAKEISTVVEAVSSRRAKRTSRTKS